MKIQCSEINLLKKEKKLPAKGSSVQFSQPLQLPFSPSGASGVSVPLFKYVKGYYFPAQTGGKSEGRGWHLKVITSLLVSGSGIFQTTLALHHQVFPKRLPV